MLQFGVSADTTAFREWAKSLAQASSPRLSTPYKRTPRNSMSRTSSHFVLTSSDSDTDDSLPSANQRTTCKQQHAGLEGNLHMPMSQVSAYSSFGVPGIYSQ